MMYSGLLYDNLKGISRVAIRNRAENIIPPLPFDSARPLEGSPPPFCEFQNVLYRPTLHSFFFRTLTFRLPHFVCACGLSPALVNFQSCARRPRPFRIPGAPDQPRVLLSAGIRFCVTGGPPPSPSPFSSSAFPGVVRCDRSSPAISSPSSFWPDFRNVRGHSAPTLVFPFLPFFKCVDNFIPSRVPFRPPFGHISSSQFSPPLPQVSFSPL